MTCSRSFFAELKRRDVIRVAGPPLGRARRAMALLPARPSRKAEA